MVREVSQGQLLEFIETIPLVVAEFYNTHCGPCADMEVFLDIAVQSEYRKDTRIEIVKINAESQSIQKRFNIQSVPSLIFFYKGKQMVFCDQQGRELDRIIGYNPNIHKLIKTVVDRVLVDV